MKVIIFGDIHGNLEAVKNLKNTQDYKTADLRICHGDIVGLGPHQLQCAKEILQDNPIMLLGNHEARMTGFMDDFERLIPGMREQFDYFKKQLKEYMHFFENAPLDYTFEMAGKKFFVTHYLWQDGKMAPRPSIEDQESIENQYAHINADYVIFGHMHKPYNIKLKNKELVCTGALGMKHPGNYLVIEEVDGKVIFSRKTVPYDKDKFFEDGQKIDYPNWKVFTRMNFSNDQEARGSRREDSSKKHIFVVAGVIYNDGQILCMERDQGKYEYTSFKFEFPGGKIEKGESHKQALARELEEEMEYDVEIGDFFMRTTHEYPDFIVTMNVYRCKAKDRNFKLNVHNSFVWLPANKLSKLNWVEGDLPIVEKLVRNLK